MVAATDSAGDLHTQVAQIGPREYVLTAWVEGAAGDVRAIEGPLRDLLRRDPAALLVDVRAVMLVDAASIEAVASAVREARDAGVFVVLVADWRDLTRAAGAEGLDRFVAIRPTLASAIEAIRGRSA